MGINYKDAGVDVEAGYEAVRQMKQYVEKPTLPMSLEESAVLEACIRWIHPVWKSLCWWPALTESAPS